MKGLPGPILITGHTGFKGTWLTYLLEELGIPVVGFSLKPTKESLFQRANRFGKIPEVFGNINNLNLLMKTFKEFKPACVIHMAAQPLVIESYVDPLGTFETNVLGAAKVFEVATRAEYVELIACTTTDKVYQNNNEDLKFREGDVLRGKDPYSASKVATESVIDAWRNLAKNRFQTELLSFRSGNVIGGGDYSSNRLIPDIVRSIYANEPLIIRNPTATRPWQHVLDPLFGYLLAIEYSKNENKPSCDTFNFGPTEKSLSVGQVIQITNNFYPRFEAPVYSRVDNADYEARELQLDSSRARNLLRWVPKLSQEQAVTSSLTWWIDAMENGVPADELCKNEVRSYLQE